LRDASDDYARHKHYKHFPVFYLIISSQAQAQEQQQPTRNYTQQRSISQSIQFHKQKAAQILVIFLAAKDACHQQTSL